MSITSENINGVVVSIFKRVLEEAADQCAEEAARIAAERARRHVKAAFAKFAAETTCNSSFEMLSGSLALTVKLPDAVLRAGKEAMVSALLGDARDER